MQRAAVIGCGALGTILVTNFAKAEGWMLTGVMARTKAHAEALAAKSGCRAATTLEELLADKPDLVIEIAGIGAAKAYGEAVLEAGCDFVLVSAGAPGLMGVELPADRETLAFEGGVEEAVRGFPKNINVSAATAAAADAPNVRVRLIAKPGLTVNTHHIDVKAGEMHCELFFHSAYDPKNPRSSTSTAWSVLALLKNLKSPISYF